MIKEVMHKNTNEIEIYCAVESKLKLNLECLCYKKIEAKINTGSFSNGNACTGLGLPNQLFSKEIKPVVTTKKEFEFRDFKLLVVLFGF